MDWKHPGAAENAEDLEGDLDDVLRAMVVVAEEEEIFAWVKGRLEIAEDIWQDHLSRPNS